MKTKQARTVDLSRALRTQASAVATEQARGTPGRRGVVATVGTDGTITTDDGIVALRLETYANPLVGDVINLSQTTVGSWVASGRFAGDDAWHTPTLMGTWTPGFVSAGYQPPRWRQTAGGVVMIQGLVATTASVSGGHPLFTLPAGSRPPATVVWPAISTGNSCRQIEVTSAGVLQVASLPSSPSGVSFLSITGQFTTF